MKLSKFLRIAKAGIEDPARWCKGVYARDQYGIEVDSRSEHACTWCALGAVRAFADSPDSSWPFYGAASALNRATPEGYDGVHEFNDREETTHADIMAVYDRAIATAEAEENEND